jgi:hypothetical protein
MKILNLFKELVKNQLSAKSLPRVVSAVVLVLGSFWLVKTVYTEWQVMRIVSVISEAIYPHSSDKIKYLPADINDTRA